MKELLEIKTGQCVPGASFHPNEKIVTRYLIVSPRPGSLGNREGIIVYDENEEPIEKFASWTHMRAVFENRGWQIADHTIWDDSDTYLGHIRQTRSEEPATHSEVIL